MEKSRFIDLYLKDLREGNAAIFAGAGLSVSAGFVNWRELLRDIAAELNLNIDRESDFVAIAQYHVNSKGQNRGQLNKVILEEFPAEKSPTECHRILARLPISTWWTTNYDKLIETALTDEGRVADIKYQVDQLAHTKPNRNVTVFKMHGDVEHPSDVVLTRDDYEKYAFKRGAFLNALTGDLTSKTFLFIGFSFTDPNLERVLAQIRYRFAENQRPHYALFKSVSEHDCEDADELEYAKNRQAIVLEDLKRYNIESVLVDSYDQVPRVVSEIYRRFVQNSIFVSTSAHDYSPWGEQHVHSFMEKLGGLLIERNLKVVSGVGVGAGNALLGGSILSLSRNPEKRFDDNLIVRPFPQFPNDPDEREALWDSYRRDMIARAGIAIFLFGNKQAGNAVVPATGMQSEFEIAKELGLFVIPVGATGSISRDLGRDVLSIPQPVEVGEKGREILTNLQKPVEELDQLIGPILDLIDLLKEPS